jgi:glycosyltransferase involved in cell wall biosynthesis
MSLPSFSVVIPTRSRSEQLSACIRKLERLDYPTDRFEVIVVDDGSEHEPRIEPSDQLQCRLIRQDPRGPAAARNLGAAHAEGEYLAFVDDDCEPDRGWLSAFADRFSAVPETVLGGRTINGLPENNCSAASQLLVSYLQAYYRNGDTSQPGFFASNNLAFPAKLFRELDGFSTRFRRAAGEDRELCARMLDRGVDLEYVPDAVVHHAHALDLGSFCRQHFNYGRGAFAFHQVRRSRNGAGTFIPEPPRFYLQLVSYPFAGQPQRAPLVLSALLALSQVANAGGFLWEALAHRRTMMEVG